MNEFSFPGQLNLVDLQSKAIVLLGNGDAHTSGLLMRAYDELSRMRMIAGALLEDQGAKFAASQSIASGRRWRLRSGEVVEVARVEVLQGELTVTLRYPQRGEEIDVLAKYLLTWCSPVT